MVRRFWWLLGSGAMVLRNIGALAAQGRIASDSWLCGIVSWELWLSSRYYWEGKRDSLCGGRCIFSRTDGLVGIPSGEDTSTCVGI